MKKILALLLAALMVLSLAACGGNGGNESKAPETTKATEKETEKETEKATEKETEKETESEPVTGGSIEMEVTFADENLEKFRAIVADFEKESGVTVDIVAPGNDYETAMKTRMGGNDLPDVWMTHGWSVIRYSEYLLPLTGYTDIKDAMDDSVFGVINNDKGDFFCACVTESVSGLMYNADTLADCGIDPYDLGTLDKLEAAMAKAKEKGYVPLYIGGSVSGNNAGFLGSLMPSMQTDEGCANPQGDNLRAGTYDWDKDGVEVLSKLAEWVKNGWVNDNVLTATTEEMQTALGEGKCAFVFRGANNITMARNYVPDCNVSIVPIPNSGTGAPTYKIGEGCTFAIWKDTQNLEGALAWLRFTCRPEICSRIAAIEGNIPSIKGAEVEDNYAIDQFHLSQEKLANISYDNVFDRKYFPSGMWGTMGNAVATVLDDPTETGIQAAKDELKEQYFLLLEQQ